MPSWLVTVLDLAHRVTRRADPLIGPVVRSLGALTGWGSRRLAWRLWLTTVGLTGAWLALRTQTQGLSGGLLFDAALQGIVVWATLLLLGSALAAPADRVSLAGTLLRTVALISLTGGVLAVASEPGSISAVHLGRGLVEIGAAWAATTQLPEGRVRLGRPALLPAVVRNRR